MNKWNTEKGKYREIRRYVKSLCGFKPSYRQIYIFNKVRITSPDLSTVDKETEKLIYLGDRILENIISMYLYQRFFYFSAEQIHDACQRITNKYYLSRLAQKLKVNVDNIDSDEGILLRDYIYSDTLKAFIAAVFLCKGFSFTQKLISKQLLKYQKLIKTLSNENTNYKGKLLTWAQKNKSEINFVTQKELKYCNKSVYVVSLYVNKEWMSNGCDTIVKNAEQNAAIIAYDILQQS